MFALKFIAWKHCLYKAEIETHREMVDMQSDRMDVPFNARFRDIDWDGACEFLNPVCRLKRWENRLVYIHNYTTQVTWDMFSDK